MDAHFLLRKRTDFTQKHANQQSSSRQMSNLQYNLDKIITRSQLFLLPSFLLLMIQYRYKDKIFPLPTRLQIQLLPSRFHPLLQHYNKLNKIKSLLILDKKLKNFFQFYISLFSVPSSTMQPFSCYNYFGGF